LRGEVKPWTKVQPLTFELLAARALGKLPCAAPRLLAVGLFWT